MRTTGRRDVTGLVLAGGAGSRLGGRDKGWVVHQHRPLVEQVIERLAPQVGALRISANRSLERYAALGFAVVTDDPAWLPCPGPLAGLLAGLQGLESEWLAVVPCDAPRLPCDLVDRLADAAAAGHRAAVARTSAGIEPLFCLLHRTLHGALREALAAGTRGAGAWLDAVGVVAVPYDDVTAFSNINRPDDLR
jgi:molybdopterin-guanine dinucleotide biosynthesis protein A